MILHNDFHNAINRVVWRAVEDHPRPDHEAGNEGHMGGAHQGEGGGEDLLREPAELYEERLSEKGLTESVEPAD